MNELTNMQERSAARLASADFVKAETTANGKVIPVFTERHGDLANKIQRALGSLGISLVALTPVARRLGGDGKRVIALNVPLIIQVQEMVLFNQGNTGTKMPALSAVVAVMQRIHFWSHGVNSNNAQISRIEIDDPPFVLVTEQPILTYNVNFIAPVTLDPQNVAPLVTLVDENGILIVDETGGGIAG